MGGLPERRSEQEPPLERNLCALLLIDDKMYGKKVKSGIRYRQRRKPVTRA
jgi:hypothetical protein